MLFERGSQCDHDNRDCRQLKTIEQLGKTFMNILGAFDQFDPFKGRIPLRSLSGSGYIAKKARKIIQPHDRDNIHEILEFIDSMIAKDEYQVIMKQIRKSDYGSIYFTPPIFIKMHLDELGRKTLAEFHTLNVSWAQVFAYISLVIIMQSKYMNEVELSLLGYTEDEIPIQRDQFLNELTNCALDAIAISEQLDFKQKRTRKASLKRHNQMDKLKKELSEICEKRLIPIHANNTI